MTLIKKIFNDAIGFFKEIILEPLLFFGPIALVGVFNSFYWFLLFFITVPILYHITDINEE